MGQLYWPESIGVSRYSIPSHASPLKVLRRPTYQNSVNNHLRPQSSRLIEILEDHDELTSSSNEIERFYDGLTSLNERHLDEMIETDLVSSSIG